MEREIRLTHNTKFVCTDKTVKHLTGLELDFEFTYEHIRKIFKSMKELRLPDDKLNEQAKISMLTQYGFEEHEEMETAINAYIIGFNDCKNY